MSRLTYALLVLGMIALGYVVFRIGQAQSSTLLIVLALALDIGAIIMASAYECIVAVPSKRKDNDPHTKKT